MPVVTELRIITVLFQKRNNRVRTNTQTILQNSLGTICVDHKINGITNEVKCDKRIKDKNMSTGQSVVFCVCQSNALRGTYIDANPRVSVCDNIKIEHSRVIACS